jgi:hypothetical protein
MNHARRAADTLNRHDRLFARDQQTVFISDRLKPRVVAGICATDGQGAL